MISFDQALQRFAELRGVKSSLFSADFAALRERIVELCRSPGIDGKGTVL